MRQNFVQNLFLNKKLSDNLERILPNYETFNKVKNSRDLIKFFKKHGKASYEHIRLNLYSYKIKKNKILFKLTPVSISKKSFSFKFYRNNFFEIEQTEMIDLVNKSILFNNEFLENIYSLEFISAKNEVNTGVASFLQSFEDRFFSISIEDLKKRFLDNQALKNNIENFL